jgi:microcystin-dependent protein
MARNYSSTAGVKTLASDITSSSQPTLTLTESTDDLPSPPFMLVINPDTEKEEIVLVTANQDGVSEPTYKITRGQDDTTPTTHTAGHIVKHMIVGSDLQLPHNHIDATTNVHGYSATATEINILDGATVTTAELNVLDGITATTAELNVLDGITASTTELNYTDGVTSAIQTQLNNNTPVGAVNMWVTGTAPSGWTLCQGQQLAIADFPALADVLGTTYGILTNGSGVAGTTHFRLPDLRGRVPMGAGTGRNVADSANLTARTLGAKVSDAETHVLSVGEMPSHAHNLDVGDGAGSVAKTSWMDRNASHGHGVADPGHSHTTAFTGELTSSLAGTSQTLYRLSTGPADPNYLFPGTNNVGTGISIYGSDTNHRHDIAAQGGGNAHNNTQPSTVINFIIKH